MPLPPATPDARTPRRQWRARCSGAAGRLPSHTAADEVAAGPAGRLPSHTAAEAEVPSLAFGGRRPSKGWALRGAYFRALLSHSSETSAVFAVRTVSSTFSELPVRLPCATGMRPAASQARMRSIVLAELTPLR